MANEKLWKLVLALHSKTERGELDWEKTPVSNLVQVTFPEYLIQLRRLNRDYGDATDIQIRVLNSDGEMVDEAIDPQMGQSNAYVVMDELFQAARRRAVGADRAIDDLLDRLTDEAP